MGRLNTFGFFAKLGLHLSNFNGFVSMIVPNTFLTMPYYSDFRGEILSTSMIKSLVVFDSLPFQDAVVENTIFVIQKVSDRSKMASHRVAIHDISHIMNDNRTPMSIIPQRHYNRLFGKTFNPYLTNNSVALFEKLNSCSELLSNFVEINQAIALKHDRAKYLVSDPQGKEYKKVLDGRDINRFSIDFPGIFLKYERKAIHSCKREDIFLTPEKIFFRRVGQQIIAALDKEQHYALNTLVVVNSKRDLPVLMYILSLLNSGLTNWYFQKFLKSTKEVFSEIQARQLEQLPIRRISFVTPKEERERLIGEGKDFYQRYLETELPDALLCFIEARLIERYKPDPELVRKHTANPLYKNWQIVEGALWEQSDVAHDVLVFLARQMIEMNKDKQKENRGFFEWLESQLKIQPDKKGNIGIEALTGKTQVKNYLGDYQKGEGHLSFEDLWQILEKNKNRIQTNLKSRELFDVIKTEYEKSLSRLLPLKEKLRKTDWLIDQIVYKLYGLTEEEIGIVEGQK